MCTMRGSNPDRWLERPDALTTLPYRRLAFGTVSLVVSNGSETASVVRTATAVQNGMPVAIYAACDRLAVVPRSYNKVRDLILLMSACSASALPLWLSQGLTGQAETPTLLRQSRCSGACVCTISAVFRHPSGTYFAILAM